LKAHESERGLLVKLNLIQCKFQPVEIFWITKVPLNTTRGFHAHIKCRQEIFLICGKVEVYLENSDGKQRHVLEKSGDSIQIPILTWSEQKFLTENSEIVVVASESYDENDYIREKSKFLEIIENHR
jgi:dTDP-4-dehydrorhamnose 3,5-epimerase-like enzyme